MLHVVAARASVQQTLASLDLERARLLTRVCQHWIRRVSCVPQRIL